MTLLPFLRRLAIIEAWSFLVLLGLAMPLKYLAGFPLAVTLVGSAHGLLFTLFCLALALAHFRLAWPWTRTALVFIAAWIPFAPFYVDRHTLAPLDRR
jgi:integral membrane protein